MRNVVLILLISTLLTGCGMVPSIKPTMSSEEMATRVAVLLTAMPTATGEVPALPAVESGLPTPAEPPLEGEIGAIATPTEGFVEVPAENTPASNPTLQVILNPTATEAFTATPPIAMPSDTPTVTPIPPTSTPGPANTPSGAVTATFAPSDPRSLLPVPTWTDTMDNGKNWPLGADAFTAIDFQNGFMVLTGLQKDNGWRLTTNDIDNAYIEATAKNGPACKGSDKWGVMLRSPDRATASQGYWFNITCDGRLAFQKWDGDETDSKLKVVNLLNWTSNSNIKPGANAVNRVGVLAKGSHFTLFVNGIQVGEVTDSAYPRGGYGVLIGAKDTERFNIYVDEISAWVNPPM